MTYYITYMQVCSSLPLKCKICAKGYQAFFK